MTELNELECVDGQVWANIWQTDADRADRPGQRAGHRRPWTPPACCTPDAAAGADVLNGIAALGGDEYLLTGKLWPATFRVRLDPPGDG